jgi:hypothetical protein
MVNSENLIGVSSPFSRALNRADDEEQADRRRRVKPDAQRSDMRKASLPSRFFLQRPTYARLPAG